jgi:hypothetical protein
MMNDPGKYDRLGPASNRGLWRGVLIALIIEGVAFTLIILSVRGC